MVRIKISRSNDEIIKKIRSRYDFSTDGIVARIALALSLHAQKKFKWEDKHIYHSDGHEFRDEKALFGKSPENDSYYPIFKVILDTHYQKLLGQEEFSTLFKLHLDHGLSKIRKDVLENNPGTEGESSFLENLIKLTSPEAFGEKILEPSSSPLPPSIFPEMNEGAYKAPVSFILGSKTEEEEIEIKLNNLNYFDNRNIAIAGMAGSGKTQLVRDILYQISKNTNHQLKFIFFDYKGEGDETKLNSFLQNTQCEFIDIQDGKGRLEFTPLLAIDNTGDQRRRDFSIKQFIDTARAFVPKMGEVQVNLLQEVLTNLFDETSGCTPSMSQLYDALKEKYNMEKIKPDSLFGVIRDLSDGLLFPEQPSGSIIERSTYLNLPPRLSDTLRQLCVFLLLRYFDLYFSSLNDVEPESNIMPLRYIIVIDEAHIYLKNKNARSALENILRLLRSKGVVIILISQGLEDYKTKEFDFVSQVSLPICLNIQKKDPKLIKGFLGTPKDENLLHEKINLLQSGHGLIQLDNPEIIKLRQFWKTVKKLDV